MMAKLLDDYLDKYLNDKRYPDADPEEMKRQVIRLYNKFDGIKELRREFILETRIETLFGERPSGKYEPQDLNIEAILKEKGIL